FRYRHDRPLAPQSVGHCRQTSLAPSRPTRPGDYPAGAAGVRGCPPAYSASFWPSIARPLHGLAEQETAPDWSVRTAYPLTRAPKTCAYWLGEASGRADSDI